MYMKEFVTEITNKKIFECENYLKITFYELRVKYNLTEEQVSEFLNLAKIRLENLNYRVYFTNEEYIYENSSQKVKDNELLVAIKNIRE